MSKTPETSKITIYETEDGKTRIEVRFEHENVWLTQKLMAELFECTIDNISLHLRNIYESGELSEDATTEEFSVVQLEGNRRVKRTVIFYSLEAIIAVGYRVNSARGTQFRTWATATLKNYILKGFAIDSAESSNRIEGVRVERIASSLPWQGQVGQVAKSPIG